MRVRVLCLMSWPWVSGMCQVVRAFGGLGPGLSARNFLLGVCVLSCRVSTLSRHTVLCRCELACPCASVNYCLTLANFRG